jgi:manganese-dependent inorganic pyrophosphatase
MTNNLSAETNNKPKHKRIFVVGHRNPDTDAIASAIGYAWVLDTLMPENERAEGRRYEARRIGEINPQTAYVLNRFGVESPRLVGDVWARVSEQTETVPTLNSGDSLFAAVQNIAKSRRSAPVVNEESVPLGVISSADLFGVLAGALSSASVLALADQLNRPVESAVAAKGVTLKAEDRVRDVIGQAMRADQDEFLVVDGRGKYAGLCRKSALLAPPRRQVVMVDHNELGQTVPGIEDAEIVEVLDHHRLDTMPTTVPIRFVVEPVGCCSTLVAERAFERGHRIPAPIAGVLLCAILSDTLIFRSPTTTPRDKAVAERLAEMAGLEALNGSYEAAIQALGEAMLASGSGMAGRSAAEVINTDLKFYEVNGAKIGIAQVETTNPDELRDELPNIQAALEALVVSRELALGMLMVTDVVQGNSQLVVAGQARLISALPYAHPNDGPLNAPGVVSRKKQLLPTVLSALSQV